MREVEVLRYSRLARTPLLFEEEELQPYPESVATTRAVRERCAILQQPALGSHASHGPTFGNPSSQVINKHVIDPSSQDKLNAFWCQLYVKNKFFIFFPNIQECLSYFN